MKRVFLVLPMLILMSYGAHAQLTFGVQLGLNSTTVNSHVDKKYSDNNRPAKSKFGFSFGLIANYELNDQMGIQSGLLYTQKGYQVDWDKFLKDNDMDGSVDGYWKYSYNYLELPLHFYYKINDFQIFAGPYFSYGIGGTSKVDATYKSDSEDGTIKEETSLNAVTGAIKAEDFYERKGEVGFIKSYNAFDMGLDFGLGYQYQQFLIKAQYSIGFKNLTPSVSDADSFDPNDMSYKNTGFNLSVTYLFSN